jgi:hypothetical protein
MRGYQIFKQRAGASNDLGEVLEPGFYWVRMRPSEADGALPQIPVGREHGPFSSHRDADRAARRAGKRQAQHYRCGACGCESDQAFDRCEQCGVPDQCYEVKR